MAETGSTDAGRVAFKTLGCKVNQVDSERVARVLLAGGHALAGETDAAVVVVNTCAVTGEAVAKARKAVRHASTLPGNPTVVVTGCAAVIDPDAFGLLGERVLVEPDKDAVAGVVAGLTGVVGSPIAVAARPETPVFRTRAMLKIEDGCDAYCSYCIVPYARGVPRSMPLADVVSEAERLVASGVAEIVLTGINIGRYRDDATQAGLAAVFSAVAATGVERLRLSSVEPLDLTETLLDAMASTRAACPHLHVPLQSGADRVLEAMGRTYAAHEYADVIERVREALPGVALTTDVMVGFPGETEADFDATMEVCAQIGFAKLHVFRYSPRPGTPAATMPRQVLAEESRRRAAALRDLGTGLASAYARRRVGQRAHVLIEKVVAGEGLAHGTSEDYLKVRLVSRGVQVGDVLACDLALDTDGTLIGRPV